MGTLDDADQAAVLALPHAGRKLEAGSYIVSEGFLTEAGAEMAAQSRARHEVVVRFLRMLGVSDETAELDAEGLEHHLSEETLDAMREFAPGRNTAQS